MKRKFAVAVVLIAVLLSLFLYFFHNGLVVIDGKFTAKVRLDFPKGEYAGAYACVPVVASLYELGYEQVSEYNDVIYFKKGEQVLTVDLNTLSLTCLQLQDNCIAPDSSNAHYTCIRKGQDIYVDSETFADALKLIGCSYVLSVHGPGGRIVKYTKGYHYEEWLKELEIERRESAATNGSIEEWVLEYESSYLDKDQPDTVTEGRLIVNGVDITEGNYVRIHHGYRNAELPLLAILRALDHEAYLQYDESQDRYEAVIDGKVHYTSTIAYFGISFDGEKGCVRKIENDDFIIDANCMSSQLYRVWEADVTVDYDTSTIYVFSCDPWG